jgi:hypothetical protein
MANNQNVQLIESEEDQKKKAAQSQPGSAFTTGGKPSPTGPVAPSGTQQARAAQEAGPTKGTGFTGVGRYLQANVGSRLGEKVAGRVAQTGQQAATRLGQSVQQFGQQLGQQSGELVQKQELARGALQRIAGQPQQAVEYAGMTKDPARTEFESTLPPMSEGLQEKYNQVFRRVEGGPALRPEEQVERNQQRLQSLLESLTPDEKAEYESRQYKPPQISLTPSQEEIAAYSAIAGGQFRAPTGLSDLEDIQSQARLAQELAKGTQTTAGRSALLQQIVGRGPQQYTKGKSALDALILGQAGGQLAAARRSSAGLDRQVSSQERLAQEQARQFGTEAERAKGLLTGEVKGLEAPLKSDITSRLAEFQQKRPEFLSGLQAAIDKGEITKEQASILGITQDLGFSGISKQQLKNLIEDKISASDITEQAISNPEQAAKLNALYQLTGAQQFASPEQLEKVGTLKDVKQEIGFDLSRIEGAGGKYMPVAEAKTKLDSAKKEALSIPGLKNRLNMANNPLALKTDKDGNFTKESVTTVLNKLKESQKDAYWRNSPMGEQDRKAIAALENYAQYYDLSYGQPIKIVE